MPRVNEEPSKSNPITPEIVIWYVLELHYMYQYSFMSVKHCVGLHPVILNSVKGLCVHACKCTYN